MSSQSMPARPPDPAAIFATLQSYQRSFVLKAGIDLDVFTAIAGGKQTAPEIAQARSASERGIRILCDVLTILGLLAKQGDRYSLSPDAAFFLDSRSPGYIGKAFTFLLHPLHWQGMENLSTIVRQGSISPDQSSLAPEDPIWVEFARGMAPLMQPAARAIAQFLRPLLAGKTSPKVLDVAASHGMFGITVAQESPNAQIYAVDWSNVLEVAGENARRAGIADRHHLIPGSAFEVSYGRDFAAVLLTNFLHHFDPARNVELLKRAFAALAPGGRVVILDFVPNPDRVSPPIPAMFSVAMLTTTPHGDAYTLAELEEMCVKAGFEAVELIPLESMPQSLVVARKPA